MWIWIIVFIFMFLMLYRDGREDFQNFKAVRVTPTNSVLNPMTLKTWDKETRLYNQWGKKLSEIYPIKVEKSAGSVENIEVVNKNSMYLGLVQEDTLSEALIDGKHENIRFISYISFEKPVLIVNIKSGIRTWKDLEGRRIFLGEKGSGSYKTGMSLLDLTNVDKNLVKIISGKTDVEDIINRFKMDEIDGYFLITNHPDRDVYEIVNKTKMVKIIGLEGIEEGRIKARFPLWGDKDTIDLSDYELTIMNQLRTYRQKTALICHKDADFQSIRNLVITLMRNQTYFKVKYEEKFNNIVQLDFNPEDQFSTNPMLRLHDAVIDFYKEIGLLNVNPSKNCGYFIGISECKPEIIKMPYRLL